MPESELKPERLSEKELVYWENVTRDCASDYKENMRAGTIRQFLATIDYYRRSADTKQVTDEEIDKLLGWIGYHEECWSEFPNVYKDATRDCVRQWLEQLQEQQ